MAACPFRSERLRCLVPESIVRLAWQWEALLELGLGHACEQDTVGEGGPRGIDETGNRAEDGVRQFINDSGQPRQAPAKGAAARSIAECPTRALQASILEGPSTEKATWPSERAWGGVRWW